MASILDGWNFTNEYASQLPQHRNPIAEEVIAKLIVKVPKTISVGIGTNMKNNNRDSEFNPDKYDHCGYLAKALQREDIDHAVLTCLDALANKKFDTLAFRGLSGTLIGPIVARELKKEIIVIRKEMKDYTHSHRQAEGHVAAKRYVVLDDFISGGDTVREILDAVTIFAPEARLAGGVFYTENDAWLSMRALKRRVRL